MLTIVNAIKLHKLCVKCCPHLTLVRTARWIKPWNVGPDGLWRKLRGLKVIKVKLPDFNAIRSEHKLTPEEIRSKLKEKGIAPPRHYVEKPMFLSCTNGILDPHLPPEGDGKMSLISGTGAKQRVERIGKKGKSMLALRKIRTFDEMFDIPEFADQSIDIYVKAHKALAKQNKDELREYVTEHAFVQMTHKTDLKTINWQFISCLEAPQVSHIRTFDMLSKNNVFAQITVRFHTRQILAIYDRFGYLMHGSEAIVKDVLEYVVFEKHLSNQYGVWRIHAKIIPDWMPSKPDILQTFVAPPKPPPITEQEIKTQRAGLLSDETKEEQKDSEKKKSSDPSSEPPQQPALS